MVTVKKTYLPGLTLLILLAGCKKVKIEPIESTLIGKWSYTEYYIGTGGPTDWKPVNPPMQTIEFKADGTFIPCESFLNDANHFEIVDSVTVKFQPTISGSTLMAYSIDTVARELLMSPVPNCIEGCAYKFRR